MTDMRSKARALTELHASTFWCDFLPDGSARYVATSVGWAICWILLLTVFNKTKMAGESRPTSEALL